MQLDTVIFDLDDTIYPASSGLWALIRERIDLFMTDKLNYQPEEVGHFREKFFREYGTTLRGLQITNNIDPIDYLKFVHQVPVNTLIPKNPELKEILNQIPLRKVIFTNSDRWHAKRVLEWLEITDCFDEIVDVLDVMPYCKPMKEAFNIALKKININDPTTCIMVEDSQRNLLVAKELGMVPIHVSIEMDGKSQNGWRQIKSINEFGLIVQSTYFQE